LLRTSPEPINLSSRAEGSQHRRSICRAAGSALQPCRHVDLLPGLERHDRLLLISLHAAHAPEELDLALAVQSIDRSNLDVEQLLDRSFALRLAFSLITGDRTTSKASTSLSTTLPTFFVI
jgi:hypothetical protein